MRRKGRPTILPIYIMAMAKKGEWPRINSKSEIHHREKYAEHTRRFWGWFNSLGIETSFFGYFWRRLDELFSIRRLSLLLVYCLVLSSFIFSKIDFTYNVQKGEVATSDIKSPVNIEFVDEVATAEKRKEIEDQLPPVFDYDPNAFERVYDSIYRAFLELRKDVKNYTWPTQSVRFEEAVKEFMVNQEKFEKVLGRRVPVRNFEWLIEKKFSARIENVLIRTLAKWSSWKLTDGGQTHIKDSSTDVILRSLHSGNIGQEFTLSTKEIREISWLADFSLNDIRGAETLDERDKKFLLELAQNLLVPNLTYNAKETEDRRQKAREAVLPVQRKIQKGQVIIAEGQVVQPIHLAILREIEDLKSARNSQLMTLAAALLFTLLLLVGLSYVRRFTINRVNVAAKDFFAMGIVMILITVVTKVFLLLSDQAIIAKIGGGAIPNMALWYLAPVAAGPMLVGLLILSGEVVWLYALFSSAVLAIQVEHNFGFLLVSLIGGIAGGRGVFICRQRQDIYRAGLRVGIVNALTILLVLVLEKTGDPALLNHIIWCVPAGFLSGLIAAILTIGFVPLLETWFNYTTDVKLLELASLNHPIMKEMIVKAPGTYHHSLIVGSMCEAAAEEIGANPLLAKVMAYYHDIGKIEHAQYFIENQRPGQNPHDHISPNMSKTVLIAHVKDGAEMGLKSRLGQPIIDGILQHHGTTLISFFYNKALEEQDEDIDVVNEEDFRYPGPKPQFREAALVMLADSIEAAARSLDEPNPGRLQNIVKNVIQSKFLDGQLEECNLTLRDLTVIEVAFKRILLGVYHQRVDYPMRQNHRDSQLFKKEKRGT